MKKKLWIYALCFVLLIPIQNVYAHHNKWSYSHYTKGMEYYNKGDYEHAIIEFKSAIEQDPKASYLRKLAEAYKANGEYQNAAETYYKEADAYRKMGDMNTYYAVLRIAESLYSKVELYTSTDKQPQNYQLQKYEPSNGIYIGAFIDKEENFSDFLNRFAEFNQQSEKQHAVYFTYHRYGWDFPTAWTNKVKAVNGAIHLALEPTGGLKEVKDDEYLRQFARDAYNAQIPIFIRFASEMNGGWVNWNGDPKLYIEKFRLFSKVMKEEAPNVAMVWSPAANPKKEIDKYYPGDNYVDWVGVNHYSNNYRNGDKKFPNEFTNPIEEIKYVYDTYADRKPIMISEYAASHKSSADMKDASQFAITKMHMMYEGLKLNYPRIKAINWFSMNNLIHPSTDERTKANYSIMDNQKVFDSYKDMISNDYFLSSVVNGEFAKKETVIPKYVTPYQQQAIVEPIKVMSWAKTYVPYIGKITYHINGKFKGESYQYPYEIDVVPDDLKKGKNEIKITVYTTNNKIAYEKKDVLYKPMYDKEHVKIFIGSRDAHTIEKIEKLLYPPYTNNGRTMVPIRLISEQLGIDVKWNAKDKTITLKNENKTIVLTVNKKSALINGKNTTIDASPQTQQGTTFVPLRFITEQMGLRVTYNSIEQSVLIELK